MPKKIYIYIYIYFGRNVPERESLERPVGFHSESRKTGTAVVSVPIFIFLFFLFFICL